MKVSGGVSDYFPVSSYHDGDQVTPDSEDGVDTAVVNTEDNTEDCSTQLSRSEDSKTLTSGKISTLNLHAT